MAGTKSKLIDGVSYDLSTPYDAGHVLNEAEAKVLNQVRLENIGNNVREKLKAFHAANDSASATAHIQEVNDNYQFTLANAGGGGASRTKDPVEREARAIAKDIITAHLAQTGRTIRKAPEGETDESWAEKVEAALEKQMAREEVLKEARKRVAAKQKVIDSALESDL